eukprot:Nitzschia sp. Nitz4//scaffold32_size149145//53853//56447//NITZ4_002875-RA/size149145-processed-gene-0.121-mRNA-1//-1//CDS//3329548057//3334//frame0
MESADEEEWNSSSADSQSQEWPEHQDDENDDDFIPESPAAKPRRTRSRRAAPTPTIGRPKRLSSMRFKSKSKDTENEDDPEANGFEGDEPEDPPDSDDDNYVDQEDSNDEEQEEESEEEAYTPQRRKPRSPPKRKQPTKKPPKQKKKPKRKPASDSEDDDEDFDEMVAGSKRTSKPQSSRRSTARRRTASRFEDSDDSEASPSNADDLSPTHGRPSRWSAALATQRLARMKEKHRKGTDDNDGTMSEIGSISSGSKSANAQPEVLSPSKRNSHLSSDEEFLADSTTDSDERAVFDSDSDSLDQNEESDGERSNDAVSIDHEQIGSVDGSTDDDAVSEHNQNGQLLVDLTEGDTSRHTEIQPTPRNQSSDSENESQGGLHRNRGKPKYPYCPSVEDAITLEPLPKRHVCYLSPDGNSRQCFALHTLRQVALKSAHMPFRVALDGSNQDTFLQPPHFRTAMSDDLLDQIASRFGREALDIHGPFYDRITRNLDSVEQLNSDEDSDGDDHYVDIELPDETWEEHLNNYISNQMGSKDMYTCPLCYSEIHRQMVQKDKPNGDYTNDNAYLELPADSEYDPMTVLGWLDNDRFDLASEFCFLLLAKVKKHLRDDHHVQTRGIQGNDLYQRYRIRAQDGLLQRYLHNQWRRIQATTFQGAMSIYWRSGHNQSFVYLLDRLKSDEPSDEARDFFDSMQSRAELDWDQVSLPFSRDRARDDLKDFLANDEDGEADDEGPPFLAHQQLRKLDEEDSDPNDLVHKIQRRYAENEDDEEADFGDDDPDDGSLDDEDYSEEEEEVDDWEQAIVQKRKAKQKSPGNKRATKAVSPAVGKTLKRRKSTTPSKGISSSNGATPSSAAKRRRIVEDSDDD